MWMGGQRHAPVALPQGKTRHPLHRKLCGPQGRFGLVRKISPHRDSIPYTPARSESLYRLRYPGPYVIVCIGFIYLRTEFGAGLFCTRLNPFRLRKRQTFSEGGNGIKTEGQEWFLEEKFTKLFFTMDRKETNNFIPFTHVFSKLYLYDKHTIHWGASNGPREK